MSEREAGPPVVSDRIRDVILRRVQKPGRYTGGEWNEIRKDPSRVSLKIALAFPDLYEVGMSHIGQKILYHVLNRSRDRMAERVFAPWGDYETELRRNGAPLTTLENHIPLKDFDIVGFSLLYELNYSNLLTMLDLGGISLLSSRRAEEEPLVIAGGPAAFNPEPLADFIDAFVLGDGEEVFGEIADLVLKMKKDRPERKNRLERLSRIPGVYIPSLTLPHSTPGSRLISVRPAPGVTFPIKKRCLKTLNESFFPTDIIVPNIEIVFDRVSVEAARGCPRNCRFCQARTLYFPERRRSAGQIRSAVLDSVHSTGYSDTALTALSIGDYPDLPGLLDSLMGRLGEERVSLSLSSMRPRGLTPGIAENILRVRKTGFTLVPEAGTARLRTVINKHLSDEDIHGAVDAAFTNGWRKLKLYFMVGLPGETHEDVLGIVDTVRDIVGRGRRILGKPPQINLSVASFIPKPHTPFQWAGMDSEGRLREKHRLVREGLSRFRSVRVKPHQLETSRLEAVFSRGDRRLGAVLLRAWREGARFDGWSETFRYELWLDAFEREGLDPGIFLGSIDQTETLPWDFIDTGVRRSYLEREYQRALAGQPTPPCAPDRCPTCRGCESGFVSDPHTEEPAAGDKPPSSPGRVPPAAGGDPIRRFRMFFSKGGPARYLSHRDTAAALQRSFRRAGIPVAYSQGFHPKMLMSFAPALPLGMASEGEVVDFKSEGGFRSEALPDRLNRSLPRGLIVQTVEELAAGVPRLANAMKSLEYSLRMDDPDIIQALTILNQGREPDTEEMCRLARGLIEDAKSPSPAEALKAPDFEVLCDCRCIRLTLPVIGGRAPRPQDIFQQMFSLDSPPVFALTRVRILLETLPHDAEKT